MSAADSTIGSNFLQVSAHSEYSGDFPVSMYVQHGRDLETWYLEAGRHLGTFVSDTEVGVLKIADSGFRGHSFLIG